MPRMPQLPKDYPHPDSFRRCEMAGYVFSGHIIRGEGVERQHIWQVQFDGQPIGSIALRLFKAGKRYTPALFIPGEPQTKMYCGTMATRIYGSLIAATSRLLEMATE